MVVFLSVMIQTLLYFTILFHVEYASMEINKCDCQAVCSLCSFPFNKDRKYCGEITGCMENGCCEDCGPTQLAQPYGTTAGGEKCQFYDSHVGCSGCFAKEISCCPLCTPLTNGMPFCHSCSCLLGCFEFNRLNTKSVLCTASCDYNYGFDVCRNRSAQDPNILSPANPNVSQTSLAPHVPRFGLFRLPKWWSKFLHYSFLRKHVIAVICFVIVLSLMWSCRYIFWCQFSNRTQRFDESDDAGVELLGIQSDD